MERKGCLGAFIFFLVVVLLLLLLPILQDLPVLKGVDLPNIGVSGIGDGLQQMFEGITRSIRF
jgi:hypothetical protein